MAIKPFEVRIAEDSADAAEKLIDDYLKEATINPSVNSITIPLALLDNFPSLTGGQERELTSRYKEAGWKDAFFIEENYGSPRFVLYL